jgi:nitrite reductase/ring-hydroxylating ferredoxin subunit
MSRILSIALLLLASTSCEKDNTMIPYVAVDFTVYVTDPMYTDLNAVGGWMYVTGGSRGILLYRKSIDQVMAYDRHCTYEPENSCGQIEVESNNYTMIDSCCYSRFEIDNGSAVVQPATLSLKQYHTTLDGNMLHVYN